MRVLLLQSSPYLPSLGGANKANRLLLEGLAARGHACRAVGPAGEGSGAAAITAIAAIAAIHAGVEVRPVADPARLRAEAAAEIAAFRPDRVLVSSEDPAQILLEAALDAAPGRVVYIAHTSLSLPFGPFAFLPSPGRAALLRRAAAVVTVSRALQEYIRRFGGIAAEVLRFPSYGAGPFPRLGRWDAGAVTLINPCAVKGIAIFLELARRFPEVPFAAVPTWGTTAADREALAALPNLRLLDPDPDVDRIFARTNVLAVPSLWGEAFGQVAVEAMLRGIPVLASDVGGLPEAKLGVPYVLPVRPIERYRESLDDRRIPVAEVPEQDVEPWAAALAELLGDRGRYEAIADEGRQAALDFAAGARIEPFEELLAKLPAMPAMPATAATAGAGGGGKGKILLIQPLAWLFAPGGAHKTNRLVMEGLAARGYECRAVAGSTDAGMDGGELAERLAARGIPVLAPALAGRGPVTVFCHNGVTVHAVTGGIELGQEAVRQIRDFAPDRVVVSEDRTYVLLKAALEEAPGRVVAFAHSPATLPFGPDSFCADPHNAALLGRAAGILTVSRFMQDYIRRWAGLDSAVVYSPAYPPGPHPLLGRWAAGAVVLVNPSPIKGLAIFLELARRFPEVPFAAVPTWSTGAAERRLLEAFPNVEVWEPVEDLAVLFGRTRVLLAPSLWGEAFGQIVVEAMLHGVPVLASDSGGLPEAKLGLPYVLPVARIERWEDRVDDRLVPVPVVPEQDAGPWERALAELLGDRERYERLAADSHRAAAEFLGGLGVAAYDRFLAGLVPVPAAPAAAAASAGLRGKLADLPPGKLELLARRLRRQDKEKAGVPAAAPGIPRLPRQAGGGGTFPLSFAQQRLWFFDRFEPGSALYNEYFAVRLTGRLAVPALARSIASIVARHEVLRTTFREEGGEPVQAVAPPASPETPLPLLDLAALPGALREAEAGRLVRAEGTRPFDLQRGPVLRAALLRLEAGEHLLMVSVHHIAADHWSIAVMVSELAAGYRAWQTGRPAPLPPLAVQYADFAAWQRGWLRGEVLASHLGFWRARLAGALSLLDLPADRPRPAVPGYGGAAAWLNLPRGLTGDLKALARSADATFYMLLLAAFQALLGRHTGQDDVVVGSPVAGRSRVELEGLIGLFLNVLPMRGRPVPEASFRGFLGEVRSAALAAYAHQDLPFEELVRDLAPERSLGRNPVFQVLLNLQNTPVHGLDLDGVALQPVPVATGKTKFDLDLYLEEWEQALTGYLLYSTDLFDATTAARLLGHFAVLLAGATADPQARIGDLPLLSEPERQSLLAEWNDTRAGYRGGGETLFLHQLVEAQAARTPEAPALLFGERSLTYRELNAQAGRLARRLREFGCGPDVPIGVCMERCAEMVVALLGVLKAGGAYLALDPEHPPERIAWMLAESRTPVVLAQEALLSRLPAHGAAVLCAEAAWGADAEVAGEPGPAGGVAADNLAYVLYTSGSTGRPKGVMIPHRGIVNRLLWMQETYALGPHDRVLQKTPFGFDVSVWEFFWPLMTGACLVVAQPGGHRDPAYLADLIARAGVTVLHFVPSMLQAFLARPDLTGCAGVRLVVCSGEALTPELSLRCRERLDARLENLYGPTEASVDVTGWSCSQVTPRGIVPIGRPVANTWIRLLGRDGGLVPTGAPGELHIGGVQLARGYLNRPDLTAERFVPDSAGGAGERLYRTGDLARWLPGGALDYLGRIDHQVKLRGFRIELGEIEAALAALPGVAQAAVLVRDDAPGGRGLVAFVAGTAATQELKEGLRLRLPEPMVPGVFVHLPTLPLTSSGKVDRRALAALKAAPAAAAPAAVRTPVQEILAGLWAEVLGGGTPGPEDSFFDLGGHSLLATRVVSRVRETFGVDLPLKALFEAPKLAALAGRIEAAQRDGKGVAAPPLVPVPRDGVLPLSFAQQRLWFLAQLQPESAFYNVPAAFRARGGLSLPALEAALRGVVRRHEVLRTSFRAVQGRPVLEVAADIPVSIPLADLSGLPPEWREPEALRLVREEAGLPFDLTRAPLLRARLLRLGDGDQILCATLHHIASDGWSVGVLLKEAGALYAAGTAGIPSALPPLPVQYADFAAWQRQWLSGETLEAELRHWRERLAGAPPALDLPADRPRPPVPSHAGALRPVALPRGLASALGALCRRQGVTLFMALLAGFETLLLRWTGQEDLCVGVPIANRNRVEIEGLIGFFVNTLVLRADLAGDPPFAGLLARVREAALDAYAHQDLPFEKLVEELAPRSDLSRAPLCQVALALQNAPATAATTEVLPGLDLAPLPALTGTAKLDLTLILEETAAGITGVAEFSTGLFDPATVERLLGHYETLLQAAVAAPGTPLADLPLLPAGERQQILVEWADVRPPSSPGGCLQDLFAVRAAEAPDARAVVCGEEEISYRELDVQAGRLASALAGRGVQPGDFVGLLLDRSLDLPVGILGVLKAGGAYVPLDPDLPGERLAWILGDARVRVLVSRADLLDRLPGGRACEVLLLDGGESAASEPYRRPAGLPAASPAYVIYTSGSTGRPKGVVVSHANVLRLFTAAAESGIGFGSEDVWSLFHSYAFDFSVWEMWGALLHGGSLVVVPREVSRAPEVFHELLVRERVTVLNQTPSAFRVLIQADRLSPRSAELALRLVVFGGEALDPADLRPWIERHGDGRPRLVNMYGITETTVHVTFRPLTSEDTARAVGNPIGRALPDLRIRLADRGLRPVPIGIPGELCVGGAGLALGYLNRPELTAGRFIPDPFSESPGARLYRSGDLARLLPDGGLGYLGRIDQQVKIRGYRIEPGEIEAVLAAHPGVREAVVLPSGEASSAVQLLAFWVPAAGPEGPEVAAAELRRHLRSELPDYMVPAAFTRVAALPLTPNGKVDRRALAALRAAPEEAAPAAPLTPTEEILAGLWADVLGGGSPRPEDSFFDLGGHSLLSTQVLSRVRDAFGVELPLKALFEDPGLGAFAARIDAARREGLGIVAPPIVPVLRDARDARGAGDTGDTGLPLSFAQQRLWFLCQLRPESPFYNVPAAFRALGELSLPALEAALHEVVRRHEVLRTSFRVVHGRPVQEIPAIPASVSLPLPLADLSALPPHLREPEAVRLAGEEAGAPFDLGRAPLLRVRLLRLGPGEHAVLATLHHIASDGWSVGILLREIAALYSAALAGAPSPLAPLPVQYADFAAWQRRWLSGAVLAAEVAHWRERLAGAPPLLELPADRPRPPVASGRGAIFTFSLAHGGLAAFCRARGATLFMGLCAAFTALLARYTGEEDLVVGAPIANRNRAETEGLIGFFVNTLALRVDLSGDPAGEELLARVRAVALDGYSHQDLPFDKLVEELAPRRDLAWSPLVQVSLALQNMPARAAAIPGVALAPLAALTGTTKLDLSLIFEETEAGLGSLAGVAEYSRDLFDGATMARLAGHLGALAEGFASRPGARLWDLPLLRPEERGQVAAGGLLVLDRRGNPQPPGVPGELEAAGERTGDLARRLADGRLERLGRPGRRLRIRGLALQPERVEALLAACPGVCEALVAVRSGAEGEALIAWVAGDGVEPAEVRALLAAALPASLMPDAVVVLPALPRAGGGIDAAALPGPPAEPDAAPASDLERTIAEVWREVLGRPRIGIHDNFFDLGGHSLQVAEMNHRLNGRLARQRGREIPMMAHFQFTTVSALAHFLETGEGEVAAFDRQERAETRRAAAGRQRLLRQRARAR
jgi:amino acid adenylation domain-containing protein